MYNAFLVVPFVSWLAAQTIKFLIRAFSGQIELKLFYVSGGMPSAHSAVVVSLAVVALLNEGAASPLFGITAVLALIVMYDSLGVRRLAGEQAITLNKLVKALADSRLGLPAEPALKELKGHKPSEVLAGAALGALAAALFYTSKLNQQFAWLGSAPSQPELVGLAAIFWLLIAGGFVFQKVMRGRHKNSAAVKKLTEAVLIKTQVIGWPGVLLVFAGYQKASFLGWRVWPYGLLAALAIWDVVLVGKYRGNLPKVLAEEAERRRKERWLKQAKGKR